MNLSPPRSRVRSAGLAVAILGAASLPGAAAWAAAPGVVDEATIDRAKTGISLFLIDNVADLGTGVTAPCPMMTTEEFGWFMGQQGLTPNLNGWAVDLFSYDDVGDGAIGVSCGIDVDAHLDQVGSGPPHGGYFEAMILPDNATFSDVLGVIDRAAPLGPGAPDIGGEIGGTCYTGDVAACIVLWHRSGLVVNFVLGGPAAEVTQERTIALLTSVVPTIVEALAAYADAPTPGTPTTAGAPTTAVPLTAAPATAAPATAATPTSLAVPVPPVTNPVTAPPPTAAVATAPAPTTPAPTTPAPTTPAPTTPPPTTAALPLPPSSAPPTPTAAAPSTAASVPSGPLDLAAARAALAQFIAANPVGTDVVSGPGAALECPGPSMDRIGQAMTTVGLVPTLSGFRVQVVQSGIAPGLVTVACGGDVIQALVDSMDATTVSHTPLLTMYDITGVATIDQVLAERPGLTLLQSNVPSIGGEIYGGACEGAVGGGTFCVRIWHREGFVVMVEIAGSAQPGFDAAGTQLITMLVPEVVGALAVPN